MKTTETEETKHTPGFALPAVLEQLKRWRDDGARGISFDALAEHPETDEGCTFGDLIEPALAELKEPAGYLDAVDRMTAGEMKAGDAELILAVEMLAPKPTPEMIDAMKREIAKEVNAEPLFELKRLVAAIENIDFSPIPGAYDAINFAALESAISKAEGRSW
jgi:hypothetical protein